jgi:hypothetical protein
MYIFPTEGLRRITPLFFPGICGNCNTQTEILLFHSSPNKPSSSHVWRAGSAIPLQYILVSANADPQTRTATLFFQYCTCTCVCWCIIEQVIFFCYEQKVAVFLNWDQTNPEATFISCFFFFSLSSACTLSFQVSIAIHQTYNTPSHTHHHIALHKCRCWCFIIDRLPHGVFSSFSESS